MLTVTIAYPNGQREEVLLAGVPRVGESIRLQTTPADEPALVVEAVLWQEGVGGKEPFIVVAVRPRPPA